MNQNVGNASAIEDLKLRMRGFINDRVIPEETTLLAGGDAARDAMAALKTDAKSAGLWALGHPEELGGGGLSLMDFAYLNEIIGRSHFGQMAVGSVSMQDSIMLHRYGTAEQKAAWLDPLVAGDIYPSVGLTRTRSGGLRSHPDADHRRAGRRRLGHQRPQVVYHRGQFGGLHHHVL